MIVRSSAELELAIRVSVDSGRASRFALGAVHQANPVREIFDFHLLAKLMTVHQPQVDSSFFVRNESKLHITDPLA